MRLYGRAQEVDALGQRLELAVAGRGQVAFVEGEAGIGKTRLVAEAVATAGGRGFQVFQGRSEELERHRPFGALADALDCARRSPDPARAAISRLITGEAGEAGEGPGLQFRAVEAFVELVEELALAQPVVVVLEDLHWADPSTLLAVRWLGRRLAYAPVLLVGTFRPSPRHGELVRLVDACTDEGGLHVRLGPLDKATVAGLAAEAVGAPPGPRLRRQLAGAGGNPLFVLELVNALRDEGAIEVAQGRAEVGETGLPPTLGLTILRRLSVLPEATLELLRLASVLGSTLSLADLSVVARRPTVELLPALGEALGAGFLGEAGTQLVFRHDLVREAVYQDLPLAVRTGLHRDVGRALAAADASAEQVATHLALGAAPGDVEAVRWLRRAARQAASRAPGVAAELLGRAVELIDAADPARDGLLAEQVDALVWSGRLREGEALARQVLGRHHDPGVEAPLRLALGWALITQGGARDAISALETATSAPVVTDKERVQLRATASWARITGGDPDGAEAAAAVARAEAERLGDDVAWCLAISTLCAVALFRGHLDDALALGAEVVTRAEQSPMTEAQRMASHYLLTHCLVEADRLEEAAETVHQGLKASEQLGNLWHRGPLRFVSGLQRFLAGEWDDATTEVEAALALSMEMGSPLGSTESRSLLTLLAVHRGQFELAEEHLAAAGPELARSGPHPQKHWVAWGQGLLHEASHRPDQALDCLEQAWAGAVELGAVVEYPGLGPDLVRLALTGGGRDRARAVTEAVETVAARMGTASANGAALRCRGLLEADPEILLRAVTVYRTSPRPFERALACEDAAVALGRAGRVDEARRMFDEALQIYERLDAGYPIARASQLMRAVGIRKGKRGTRKRPAAGWEALTDTELRVVELVAEGLTNSQIGKRLFVSHHTVASHLSHIFAKLAINSRVELAARAARRTS